MRHDLTKRWRQGSTWILLCLLLALIGWFYLQLPDREVVGFIQDDGVYAITAKALSIGKGFNLLHVVSHPMQVKYPILYPLLLALGWSVQPDFPQNLSLLYGLTIGSFLLALVALFYYFRVARQWPVWACFALLLLVAGNSQVMQYSTMLMSEAPYLLFSTLALLYAETRLQEQPSGRNICIAIGLSALAFHSRVLGFLIIVAITGALLAKRHFKKAFAFLGGASLLTVLPWTLWAFANQPTNLDPITKTYGKYGVDFWVHSQSAYGQKLLQSFSNFIYGMLDALFPCIAHLLEVPPINVLLTGHPILFLLGSFLVILCVYGLAGYFLLRLIQGIRKLPKYFNPAEHAGFDISAWYVGLYCLVIVGWNFESQISRFLVVILPWLWFYLLDPGIACLQKKQALTKPRRLAAAILLGLSIGLAVATTPRLYTTLAYTRLSHQWINLKKSPQYVTLWEDYRATFAYIKTHLPTTATVGAGLHNSALYLYTGRVTYPINLTALDRQQGLQASSTNLWKTLQEHHVDYLLMEPEIGGASEVLYPTNMMGQALLEFYPKAFQEIYTAPSGLLTLYRIHR